MDKPKILQMVMGNAQKAMKRKLSELEIVYVKGQLNDFVKDKDMHEMRESFPIFMKLVIEGLKNPRSVHKALAEPHQVDIHEMLKQQITEDTKKVEAKNPSDITSILGLEPGMELLKMFNPQAAIYTSYVILDRKFQTRNNSLDTFSWNLALSGQGYNHDTSAVCTTMPKNIIGAKIIPFRFPRTEAAITFSKRLSINIQELEMHAYVASDNRWRFHFLFSLIEDGGNPNDPYILANSGGENTTEFWLGSKVQEIDSITLTFGNPFTKLTLDPDRLPATIASVGVQAVLSFAQPHFVSVGDNVTIEDFTTNNIIADFVEIQLMNDDTGWPVVAATATTLTIDVDLTGLTGAITTPTSIYLDSKRFIIPMEIKYIAGD